MNLQVMINGSFHTVRVNKKLTFGRKLNAFQREMRALPDKIGDLMLAQTMKNFAVEGFIDNGIERWPDKLKSNGKPILIASGKMKRTIKKQRTGMSVALVAPVSYSGIHNRPVGVMKKYATGMYPGRKFMGNSKELRTSVTKLIVTRLNLAAQV